MSTDNPVISGNISINFEIADNGNVYDVLYTDGFGI